MRGSAGELPRTSGITQRQRSGAATVTGCLPTAAQLYRAFSQPRSLPMVWRRQGCIVDNRLRCEGCAGGGLGRWRCKDRGLKLPLPTPHNIEERKREREKEEEKESSSSFSPATVTTAVADLLDGQGGENGWV